MLNGHPCKTGQQLCTCSTVKRSSINITRLKVRWGKHHGNIYLGCFSVCYQTASITLVGVCREDDSNARDRLSRALAQIFKELI